MGTKEYNNVFLRKEEEEGHSPSVKDSDHTGGSCQNADTIAIAIAIHWSA